MDYFVKKSEKWSIEPEEILLDKHSAEKLDNSKFEMPIPDKNFLVLFAIIAVVFLIFIGKAGYMQIAQNKKYAKMAGNNKTRNYPVFAQRGIFYDRNMAPLVENIPGFDLVVIPADLPKNKNDRAMLAVNLAKFVGIQELALEERFAKLSLADINPAIIKENIERETALSLETRLSDFPGVELKKRSVRHYPDSNYFAHTLGYTDRVSESDLKSRPELSSLDLIGKLGLEFYYDSYIRGNNGIIEREVDAVSSLKKERQVKDASPGLDLVLTVDKGLQQKVVDVLEEELKRNDTATGASAVAINPKTGEILALASLPTYDSNIFSTVSSREAYQGLIQDPHRPFFNRVISGQYSPGSSIKPFFAVAALEEKLISERTSVLSTGAITIANQYDLSIVYTFRDWKAGGHGDVNVVRAIADSVNTFFYTIGGGYGDLKGLGTAKMKSYLEKFGFGAPSGIDLPQEGKGIIPDPQWKEKTWNEKWYLGDTYNISIGQGSLLVTPLQVAVGYSALANGGKLIKPILVKKAVGSDKAALFENPPKVIRDNFISEKNLEIIKKGLRETVLSGTAQRLQTLPVAVAGKTGTTQTGGEETHAWFSSFAPYEDPSIVLIILVEKGGQGSQSAVAAAEEIYKWYFGEK